MVPTCDTPAFVNEGASAIIICTAERIYSDAICNFELVVSFSYGFYIHCLF